MKKKKPIAIVAAVLVALTALAGWRAFSVPPRFNQDDIARIKLGMTKDDVVAILGCPPGGYDGYFGDHDVEGQIQRGVPNADLIGPQKNGETWACRGTAVEVCFYDDKVSLIQPLIARPAEGWWMRCWRRIMRK